MSKKQFLFCVIMVVIGFPFYSYHYKPIDFLKELENISDFQKLKGKPLTNKYGRVDALKVVYDLRTEKLFYVNSTVYKYHYEFCKAHLDYNTDLFYFNLYSYSDNHEKKRFLLGNINYYSTTNLYTLELSSIDKMLPNHIEKLYTAIQKTSYFENFKFFLNTVKAKNNRLSIPTITSNEIYKNQTYQALSLQKKYGKLRYVNIDSFAYQNVSKNDIIIVNKPVLDLPIVNGVITTKLQTPLSHISILGKNRKIPIAAYKNAYTSEFIRKLNNQYVSLEVRMDTFYIKKISKEKFLRKNKPKLKKKKVLPKNLLKTTLFEMEDVNHKSVDFVGGKAANFAELSKLSKKNDFKVPESAFAIPFYFYDQHIKKANVKNDIEQLISDFENDEIFDLKNRLKTIKKKIKNTKLNATLINSVTQKIKALGSFTRMRFRSSTNAEDIKGFSGAGLYTSKTGIIGDSIKTIEKAIVKVWASLWNERAFLERTYFNIDQRSVAMGVLVHRSFPNEKANGVIITKNLYRQNYFGNVINVQVGEHSVVEPKENVVCDQILCYSGAASLLHDLSDPIEIISYSSLNNGKLVLSEKEIIHVSRQAEKIKQYFHRNVYRRSKTYLDFALDIEFKIEGENRSLYIKQARYFND